MEQALLLNLPGGPYSLHGISEHELGRLKLALGGQGESIPVICKRNTEAQISQNRPDNEFDLEFHYQEHSVSVTGKHMDMFLELVPRANARVEAQTSIDPYMEGNIENVLRIVVAYHVLQTGGLMLHSGCFNDGKQAWVVFGHSGAGKSTASRFAVDASLQVMSDDINLLVPDEQYGWMVHKVPFSGDYQPDYTGPEKLPLAGIYHLNQSPDNRLQPVSPAEGVSLLSASAPFINEDPWRADQLLAVCADIVSTHPVSRLYFAKNPDFLKLLNVTH